MSTEPLRLDEAGTLFPYVNTNSQWVHRCAKRILELDPDLEPLAAMHAVDDMATSPRWRLMLPEAVAEALYGDDPIRLASRGAEPRWPGAKSGLLAARRALFTKGYRSFPLRR